MAIGIEFLLKASTDGFRAGMASAQNTVADMKKGIRDLGIGGGIGQMIGVGGLIAGFKAAVSHAQEMRDALEASGKAVPASVARAAAIGDTLQSISRGVKEAAVSSIGFVSGAFEKVADMVNKVRGVSVEQAAAYQKTFVDSEKALERIDAAAAKFRAENSPEKIAEAERKLEDGRRKAQLERLQGEEKIAAMQAEVLDMQAKLAETNKATVRYRELQLEIENKAADVAKESAKYAAEEEKFREGIYKASEAMAESVAEIRREESAAAAEKRKAAAEAAQSAQDEYNLNVRITAEKEAQAAADAAKARSWAGTSGPLGLRGLETTPDDVLKADLNKRTRELEASRVRQGISAPEFQRLNFFEFSQINSIKEELAFRTSFERAFARGGRQGALNQYVSEGRNPMGFDVALANMSSWNATASATEKSVRTTAEVIGRIDNRLAAVFGK